MKFTYIELFTRIVHPLSVIKREKTSFWQKSSSAYRSTRHLLLLVL
jgi:hypothetical protein